MKRVLFCLSCLILVYVAAAAARADEPKLSDNMFGDWVLITKNEDAFMNPKIAGHLSIGKDKNFVGQITESYKLPIMKNKEEYTYKVKQGNCFVIQEEVGFFKYRDYEFLFGNMTEQLFKPQRCRDTSDNVNPNAMMYSAVSYKDLSPDIANSYGEILIRVVNSQNQLVEEEFYFTRENKLPEIQRKFTEDCKRIIADRDAQKKIDAEKDSLQFAKKRKELVAKYGAKDAEAIGRGNPYVGMKEEVLLLSLNRRMDRCKMLKTSDSRGTLDVIVEETPMLSTSYTYYYLRNHVLIEIRKIER